jgi:hypothetical protein
MTGYAFGLTTPRDLLEKARREVRRLEVATAGASSPKGVPDLQDTAFNAAVTLWHVSDWIANSTEQKYIDAIERIRLERPSQKTVRLLILREHILDDPHMAICEALANGAKHLELHEPPSFVSSRIFAPQTNLHAAAAPVVLTANVTAGPAVGVAPIRYFAKLKINDVGIPALDVFKAALAYWDKFLADYGL